VDSHEEERKRMAYIIRIRRHGLANKYPMTLFGPFEMQLCFTGRKAHHGTCESVLLEGATLPYCFSGTVFETTENAIFWGTL
jgi:hypothetical protein